MPTTIVIFPEMAHMQKWTQPLHPLHLGPRIPFLSVKGLGEPSTEAICNKR